MWLGAREPSLGGSAPTSFPNASVYTCTRGGLIGAACPSVKAGEGWDSCQWDWYCPWLEFTTPESVHGLATMPGMEWTDSKCPPTPQVRRGHPTVHSETKYVELIVINDHQLVSS